MAHNPTCKYMVLATGIAYTRTRSEEYTTGLTQLYCSLLQRQSSTQWYHSFTQSHPSLPTLGACI